MPRMDMPEGANVAVPGEYSLIQSAMSNKGNATSQGFNNLMVVEQNQPVRIVDKSGNILFEGIGPDAARQAVALGQNLSDTQGKKAGWDIQTVPVGSSNYKTIANEKADKSVLGQIADVALPIAASFIPGVGPVLGATLGSAASSVAQGRGIGETLMRAGLSAGGAAAGGAILGKVAPTGATVGSNLPSWGSMVAPNAANAAGSAVGSAAGSGASELIDNIIVTALNKASPSVLGPAVTGGISNTLLNQVINQPSQAQTTTQQEYTPPSDELIVTAKNAAPVTFGNVAPVLLPSVGAALGSSIASTATPDLTQTPEKNGLLGRLTANMGITDYLTAASLLGSGVSSLLGGGGGAGTTAGPYVSPFGAGLGGAGFGAGQDMRVNPNIADYERYGFGPEASFFAPGYSQLVSGAAGAPAATTAGPASAMVNPQYVPLI